MSAGRPNMILVANIRLDGDTQARVKLDDEAIADYAERMKSGTEFPRVVVFDDGKSLWLADGFHRVRAALSINKKAIKAEVIKGTKEEAIWYALGANKENGVRRSNSDKDHAVRRALSIQPGFSDQMISNHVGVSDHMVHSRRMSMISMGTIPNVAKKAADGRRFEPPPESRTLVSNSNRSSCSPLSYNPNSERKSDAPPTLTDDLPPTLDLPPTPEIDPPPLSEKTENDPPPSAPDVPPLPVDRLGKPIKSDVVAALFARDRELTELCQRVSAIKQAVLNACERHDQLFAFVTPAAFQVDIDNVYHALKKARPYTVCSYCGGGANCKACHGSGFLTEIAYTHAPKELKK